MGRFKRIVAILEWATCARVARGEVATWVSYSTHPSLARPPHHSISFLLLIFSSSLLLPGSLAQEPDKEKKKKKNLELNLHSSPSPSSPPSFLSLFFFLPLLRAPPCTEPRRRASTPRKNNVVKDRRDAGARKRRGEGNKDPPRKLEPVG